MRVASGQAKKNLFEGGGAGALLKGGEGITCKEASFVEDGDAIGEQFDLRQGVRSEQQRSIAASEEMRFQEAAEVHSSDGIEAAGGFIEQKHARLVEKGAEEAETLNRAGGECAHLAVEGFDEMKLFRELVDADACSAVREMVEAAEEEQVLAPGQAGVETVVRAGVIAEKAADGGRLVRGMVTGHGGSAA
jgi:hypothetical protein